MIVDDDMRLSYKEILELKVGDIFCEEGVNFEVISEPSTKIVTMMGDEWEQLTFQAKCLIDNENCDYLITKGLEHYGPKIYSRDEHYLRKKGKL